jgi:predicted ATPase/DNA-binding winged helix-turn-helix (wHTH) protein
MRVEENKDIAFAFGPFRLIPSRQVLIKGQSPVKLGSRAFDILHLLLTRAGEAVSKDLLIEFAWPNVYVDQANLKVHISSLRRALEDSIPQPTYIATIPGHGYQFVAQVRMEQVGVIDFQEEQPVVSSLPAASTLIGRQRDLEGVTRALDFTRFVSLVGPGGVGKTSLAIAVAHAKRDKFPDGVHFVDFAATDDSALVPHLLAIALGVRGNSADVISTIVQQLKNKRILIVLDNCEHLLHAVATLAAQLVQANISSSLLATSREPLGISGENVQRVDPLPFPELMHTGNTREAALAYPAMELFRLRALETAEYKLADEDIDAVARLCEALDGLPLAIEIAAAKLAHFSAAQLLDSVSRHFSDFRNNDGGAHSRHRTLSATLDWSYQLLSEQEATIFRLLSVFTSSFEWTDVTGLAQLVHYDPYQTTVALGALVSKSLLSVEIEGEQLRYRLLFSARDFAAERLEDDPYARKAHQQHALSVLSTLEKAETEWSWVDNIVWRTRYGEKVADLRKALDWCFGKDGDPSLGISLAVAAIRLWNEQSSTIDQLIQVDRALQHCASLPDTSKRGALLATSRAWGLIHARRLLSEADDAWNTALSVAQLDGEVDQQIAVQCGRVIFFVYTGRSEQAITVLDDFIRIAKRADDQASLFDEARLRAFVRIHLGYVLDVRMNLEQLAKELLRGVPSSRAASRYGLQREVSVQTVLALANWLTGRPHRARKALEELLLKAGEARQLIGQAHVLTLFAMPLALWNGDIDALERYSITLRDILHAENIALWEPVQRFYESVARQARGVNAVDEIRSAIKDLVRDNFLFRTPMYLGVLAEILLGLGQNAESQETIESALAMQHQLHEEWCMPELLRIKANVLHALGDRAMADVWRRRALETAIRTGSILLELRVLNDLAELAIREGDFPRALDSLNSLSQLHDKEEELVTEDLRRRARLLAEANAFSSPDRQCVSAV